MKTKRMKKERKNKEKGYFFSSRKYFMQTYPLETNFGATLPTTKLMFAYNWQSVSFMLMKINVDTNKRR